MKRARRFLLVGLVSTTLGVVILVVYTITIAGEFRTIEPHSRAKCETIEGFAGGTEDFIDRPDGTLFVSSPDFRDAEKGGRIYLVDPKDRSLRDVTPDLGFSFQPHGVGLWTGPDSERLFVVNHRDGSGVPDASEADAAETVHSIEIFEVAPNGDLKHISSTRGDALISPNDVAPVGPESFYTTNDHGYGHGIMRTLEDYLRIPAGNVIYGDGGSLHVAWEGSRYANGVAVEPGGKHVYIAETTGFLVRKLARDPETGELESVATYDLETAPDNLNFDAQGNLWTAAHPKLLTFTKHAKDPAVPSPSQVLRIRPGAGDEFELDEIWLDDGTLMSGSSVAWTNGEEVFTGSVFEGKLVVCPIP